MTFWQDLRYGARVLRSSPGFTVTAIVTLALGIGATTAIFSVCDAMLWKPVPLPHMESMAILVQAIPGNPMDWNNMTPADTTDIRERNQSFVSLASYTGGLANLAGAGSEPDRVQQALVSPGFFRTAGVQPMLGRAFLPDESQPGRDREVILSYNLWRNRFGANPSLVGKTIHLDDLEYTVVGIMPMTFDFPLATELWTPLAFKPAEWNSRVNQSLQSIARLKPGVSMEQANADVERIAGNLERAWPESNRHRRFRVVPALRFIIGEYDRQYMMMLLGAVIFVLLIACLNVANLQFARATVRLREVALRTALGAGRTRIIRQLLTESVLLAIAGAGAGLLVAVWGIRTIKAGMPAEIERYVLGWSDIGLDGRALLFTLAAAVGSGIIAGLVPALQSSRPNVAAALKEGGRSGSSSAHHRLRGVFVAAEMALAVVLLVGGSLMVRGFQKLVNTATRSDPATLLTMRLAITETRYPEDHQVSEFYRRVLENVKAVPGVLAAGEVAHMPYGGSSNSRYFMIENRTVLPGDRPLALYQPMSTGYFETMHIPLTAGRGLDERDGAEAPKTAVVSQRFVEQFFHGESPLGKRVRIGLEDSKDPWLTIVGVAGDVIHDVYDRNPRPTLYVSARQFPARFMDIGVRSAGDPLRLVPSVLSAIHSVDAEQPVTDIRTLETAIHQQATGLSYMAVLMGIFGVLALVLSTVGVYGVMAYLVSERTREIGIRMALGSGRGEVMALVFRRGMSTAIGGLLVGIPAAYLFARLLSALVFGVTPTDLPTFTAIPLALAISAALAIYIPARRATRIDPIVALRYE